MTNSKLIKITVIPFVAVIMLSAGIFALMPVDLASTVHGSLTTVAQQTTTTTLIAAEADGQDRYATFRVNFTNNLPQQIILIPANSGAISGYATLTSIANSNNQTSTLPNSQCGLSTTAGEQLGINATAGNTTSRELRTSILSDTEGIVVEAVNSTNDMPGVCIVTLIIDSSTG